MKKILIWGTGRMTGRLMDDADFKSRDLKIVGYIDNDTRINVYGGRY